MNTLAPQAIDGHRVIPEKRPEMLKAALRNPEKVDIQAEIGACLFRARTWVGWTLEQLASVIPPPSGKDKRDPRQVRRWESGEEKTPVELVFSVTDEAFRQAFAAQLAKLSGADVHMHAEFRRIA